MICVLSYDAVCGWGIAGPVHEKYFYGSSPGGRGFPYCLLLSRSIYPSKQKKQINWRTGNSAFHDYIELYGNKNTF